MDIELGIQNVSRPVNATVEGDVETVSNIIDEAVSSGKTIDLTDTKGRRIIVPGNALGYALIGSETKHAVGFGAL